MKTVKEIEALLPESWSDLKVKDYMKLGHLMIDEDETFGGATNTINVISVLSNVPVEDLESFTLTELCTLTRKVEFLNALPMIDQRCKINWKNVDEMTYSDFTTYEQLKDKVIENIPSIIKSFSKGKLTDEMIMDMNMHDIHTAFFFLRQQVKKYIKGIRQYLKWRLLKQEIQMKLKTLLTKGKWLRRKRKFLKVMVGIF